jgi:hypothetical protein
LADGGRWGRKIVSPPAIGERLLFAHHEDTKDTKFVAERLPAVFARRIVFVRFVPSWWTRAVFLPVGAGGW